MDDSRAVVVQETGRLNGATADRNHRRLRPCERLAHEARLDLAECGLALLREQLGDGAVPSGDRLVDVDERPTELARDMSADHRLPRPHEADEDDVPV